MSLTTLQASRAIRSLSVICSIEDGPDKDKLLLETFIDIHSHDWFSPGFLSFFTGIPVYNVEAILKFEDDTFIPTIKNVFQYQPLYTTKKKFESFSEEEKKLR